MTVKSAQPKFSVVDFILEAVARVMGWVQGLHECPRCHFMELSYRKVLLNDVIGNYGYSSYRKCTYCGLEQHLDLSQPTETWVDCSKDRCRNKNRYHIHKH